MRKKRGETGWLLRFVDLLEADLKLERARNAEMRKDVEFYRGKCERLEPKVTFAGNAQGEIIACDNSSWLISDLAKPGTTFSTAGVACRTPHALAITML